MREERMAVLRMLEKGVITAIEAERLILALQSKEKKDNIHIEEINETITDYFSKMGDCLNTFAKSVSEKAEDVKKEVEPVVKKMAESMVEKAANAAEELKTYAAAKKKEKAEQEASKEEDDESENLCQDMFEDEDEENEDLSEEDKEYVEMVKEVKQQVKSMGKVSPDEFKKAAFQEELVKETSADSAEEEKPTLCEKEKTCCNRQAEDCTKPTPCCLSNETIDWGEEWRLMDEEKENKAKESKEKEE